MEFKHVSVLFEETIDELKIKDNGIYVDGTLGGGGHTSGILSANSSSRVIGIDQDKDAIKAASERLAQFSDRVTIVKDNFLNIDKILSKLNIDKIDGAVLDLGVSSYQLDEGSRGFSYMKDAPLDMRMDSDNPLTAFRVVNTYDKDNLKKIFYEYGEEKWSSRIADFIVEKRQISPIETTGQLVDIIKAAIPKKARLDGGHPAKRCFQAIRIEVNGELRILKDAVEAFVRHLNSGGRLAVITFHSLEDRIIKKTFLEQAQGCTCPKEFPVCICGKSSEAKIVTRKPILPCKEELLYNPRAKSAKLRVLEKI